MKDNRSHKGYQFSPLSHDVVQACREVGRELGSGFAEITYQRALEVELTRRGVPFQREAELIVYYKGEAIDTRRADFLVGGELIVELKAVKDLVEDHVAQLVMYLKATRLQLGLLINFGEKFVRVRRVINSGQRQSEVEEHDD